MRALTIGLGQRLVRETLARAGTPFVELIAVMAKYNPFAEKAGMQRIVGQLPSEETLNVEKLLSEMGFNVVLLRSQAYVSKKLAARAGSFQISS